MPDVTSDHEQGWSDTVERRLVVGLLLSIVLHGLLLSLQFGTLGIGQTGLDLPLDESLSITLQTAQPTNPPTSLPTPILAPKVLPEPIPAAASTVSFNSVTPEIKALAPGINVLPYAAVVPAVVPTVIAPVPVPSVPKKPAKAVTKPAVVTAKIKTAPPPQLESPIDLIAQTQGRDDTFTVAVPDPDEPIHKNLDNKSTEIAAVQTPVPVEKLAPEEQKIKPHESVAEVKAEPLVSPQIEQDVQLAKQGELERRQQEKNLLEESQKSKVIAEQKLTEQKLAEQKLAEQKLAEQKLAEQKIAEQKIAEQKIAEQKLAEQKLAEQKLTEQKLAEQKVQSARSESLAAQASTPHPVKSAANGSASGLNDGLSGNLVLPKNLLGGEFAGKAREQIRGLDILRGTPPLPRETGSDEHSRRRKYLGHAEREIPLRLYVDSWRDKIERNGNLNYSQISKDKARGDPIVLVALRSNGSIEEMTLLRSSGRADLDEAVLRIIRVNAPYAMFPPNVAAQYDVIEFRKVFVFDNTLRVLEEFR